MEFDYLEAFGSASTESSPKKNASSGVSSTLRSLSTADFSKKLKSLSLLDIGRGSNKESRNEKSAITSNLSQNAQSIKRAKISIDLLDSLGFDYNPLSNSSTESNNNSKATIDNDDLTDIFLYNSGFDGSSLVEKLSQVLESSDGYDTSTRHSLGILERRIEYEISLENSNKNQQNDLTQNKTSLNKFDNLKNLAATGQTGNLARRNLRGLIEEDLLYQYSSQMRTFQKIVKSIDSVRPNLEVITQEYNDLANSLEKATDSLTDLKTDITSFDQQKKILDLKKNILLAFKSTFTITQYEEHVIRFADLNEQTTGTEFFNTVEKIKNIQNNCDVLLGMENEKLGMNIMKQMGEFLLTVIDRIDSYVQNNIDYVYSGNNPNFNNVKKVDVSTFQKCLIYIWHNNRNSFDSIMSSMVESRRRLISTEFINQLKGYTEEVASSNSITNNSVRRHSKQLFLSSYDTIKFLSDSLAYIHSLLVNEMENARSFLTFDFVSNEENNELEDMVDSMVITIISGLNKPLKSAVEGVLNQEGKIQTLVGSYDLLELYGGMFSKLLNPGKFTDDDKIQKDNIMVTIRELETEIQERSFFLIKLKLKNLEVEAAEEGLNTEEEGNVLPDWVVDWYGFIDELFESSTPGSTLDGVHILGLDDLRWNEMLELLVNRPIELLNKIEKDSAVSEKEKLIWELNCIDYMYNKVEINPVLSTKAEYLNTIITSDTDKLIELEFSSLLKNSGLYDIYNLVNMIFKLDDEFFDVSFYQPIVENKLFCLETFQTAKQKLEDFFSSYINQNELNSLMSPTLFNRVFFESSMNFIKFYRQLGMILNEYLKDDEGNSIKVFQWDEMTIATILGIDEYYQEHQDF